MPPAKNARLYRLNGIDRQLAFRSDGRNLDCLSVQLTDDAGPLPSQPAQDTYVAIEKVDSMAIDQDKVRSAAHTNAGAVGGGLAEDCRMPRAATGTGHHSFVGLRTRRLRFLLCCLRASGCAGGRS